MAPNVATLKVLDPAKEIAWLPKAHEAQNSRPESLTLKLAQKLQASSLDLSR